MIRQSVAIVSWCAVAAIPMLPDRLRAQAPGADLAANAAAFFISAAATRYWLQETRTREQILAFVAVGLVLGSVRCLVEGRAFPLPSFVSGAAGATLGALLVKFVLEGLPI